MNVTLNIKEVTLYKSGVGFFLADCPEAQFTLPVNERDINDVLKSLSVNGLKSVRFSSAEERERIIEKIGIQLDPQNALFSVCQHLVGCSVEIETDETFSGIVIGVDELQDDSLDLTEELLEESLSEVLVLKIEDEVRHIPFDIIKGIAIKDDVIQNDLEKFLNFISNARKAGVTILQIDAAEDSWATWVMPISSWRLSYRILFDEEQKELDLYGIAVVDNTTSIDWKEVVLRLVTGKPVSFQYDLYNPLYFERPEIEREVKGVAPIVSEAEGVFDFAEETAAEDEMDAFAPPSPRRRGPPGAPPSTAPKADRKKMAMKPMAREDGSGGAAVAEEVKPTIEATRQEIGTAIAYVVSHPITINRSQSALIPILNEQLSGERSVILRDDRINEAMDALRLKKSIDLEQAPATVYLDGIFAGDAMIVGGTDYITFRLNQEINAMKEISTKRSTKSIAVENIYLNIAVTHERNYTFKIVNRSKEAVPVLLEIEKYSDFIPQEKPNAETMDYYRYEFILKPGNTVKKYSFQKVSHQYEQISRLSSYKLDEYLNSDLLSKSDRTELLELVSLYNSFNKKQEEQKQIQREIEKEFDNQERIRENILVVKDDPELQQEYLQKLKNSEQHIENLKIELNKIKTELEELEQKILSPE